MYLIATNKLLLPTSIDIGNRKFRHGNSYEIKINKVAKIEVFGYLQFLTFTFVIGTCIKTTFYCNSIMGVLSLKCCYLLEL